VPREAEQLKTCTAPLRAPAKPGDPSQAGQLAASTSEVKLAELICVAIAKAPPLTPEQASQLAAASQ